MGVGSNDGVPVIRALGEVLKVSLGVTLKSELGIVGLADKSSASIALGTRLGKSLGKELSIRDGFEVESLLLGGLVSDKLLGRALGTSEVFNVGATLSILVGKLEGSKLGRELGIDVGKDASSLLPWNVGVTLPDL